MRLISLQLKNFKGARDFTLLCNGGNVSIYGDNETGKTTVADGMCWLLFDKDYKGSSQFEIKTLQGNGDPIHNLQHEVEGVFSLEDGARITLKKVYTEVWTKKRGSANAEFTGHTTEHYIDEVPVKQKEYQAKVAEIAPEEMFRLLTSPVYFSTVLKWERRRQILLDICGDVSDADVIASSAKLAPLAEILKSRSQEDHLKVVKSSMSKINEEIKKIPIRIDEALRGVSVDTGIDLAAEERNLADLKKVIDELKAEKARVQAGGQEAEIKKALAQVEASIMQMETEHEREARKKISLIQDEAEEVAKGIRDREETIKRLKTSVESLAKVIDTGNAPPDVSSLDVQMADLKDEWYRIFKTEYEYTGNTCPNCGFNLNEEEGAAAKFEEKKQARLTRINAEGKQLKERKEQLLKLHEEKVETARKELNANLETISRLEGEISAQQAHLSGITARVNEAVKSGKIVQPADRYQESITLKDDLQERLKALSNDETVQELTRIDFEIAKMDVKPIEEKIAKARAAEKAAARADELRAEEKKLAKEYDRLAGELHLLDIFTETKVSLLEDQVASHFAHARFKLFNRQINGGIEPCCEVIYKGIPFNSNLNDGARINVGLDIINTLSRHYGVTLPVVIDNAESVTELIPMNCQVIRLVVSKPDQVLRVELERDDISTWKTDFDSMASKKKQYGGVSA